MTDVICVWPAGAILGEGPLWSQRDNATYWVDILAPAVHPDAPGDRSIPLPASQVTSCVFAGGLFEVDPGVTGPPTEAYGG